MEVSAFLLVSGLVQVASPLPFYYKNRYAAQSSSSSSSRVSPGVLPFRSVPVLSNDVRTNEQARMLGLDTGNENADHEAGMWLMALIGTLAAAIPVAFLSPSLGFKKKRALVDEARGIESWQELLDGAMTKYHTQQDL